MLDKTQVFVFECQFRECRHHIFKIFGFSRFVDQVLFGHSFIRRDALVLKSAWKALSDPLSLLHDVIATPAKIYRQLQPPTRTSVRLNLVPMLVVEQ